MSEIENTISRLVSGDREKKEELLDSIKKALSREEEVKMEDGTVIIPDDENSVAIKLADGNYVRAVLTKDKSNVNLKDSNEVMFKKAVLELGLYNILTRTKFYSSHENPRYILEEDRKEGDIPYSPELLYLAKFFGVKDVIKPGEEDDAIQYIIKFYESLCSGLFQEIVDIAAYLLGKEFNADSLKDCFDVTDNIITLIKERYKGVPDTLTQYLSENELNKEKDSFEKAVTKVMFDSLPYLVGKLRKELGR